MKKRFNIIEAGNMPVGTRFKAFDKGGNDEELIAEVVKSKDDASNKFLAWDGDYECPLTLADTNVNCLFEIIEDKWEKVDFMTAMQHHDKGGIVRYGEEEDGVIYDGGKTTYLRPISGRKDDDISQEFRANP